LRAYGINEKEVKPLVLQTVIFRSLKPDVYTDLVIPVVNPNPVQPLFVRDITGLEPPPAAINSKGYGGIDGEFYVGGHIGKRNIVFKFGLNTSGGYQSVSAAKNAMYGYMMTKSTVWLRFITDDHAPVDIVGYVETITPTRFTDDPEYQVSIICPKPLFTSTDRKQVTGFAGTDPDEVEIFYNGTLASGIGLILDMGNFDYNGPVILETRISEPVYQTFSLYDDTHIDKDYQLWINTETGSKGVTAVPSEGGEDINLLKQMDPDSWWMFLVPGLNRFRVRTPESNNHRGWTMSYLELYGGI
jgi:hypothetical protein